MDMLYGFWVYVNRPHDYARVHKAECGHCQGGIGKTGQGLDPEWPVDRSIRL